MNDKEIGEGRAPIASSTVREPEPTPDISRISPPSRRTRFPNVQEYEESPYGKGSGTVLTASQSRADRASEDEFLDFDKALSYFQELSDTVTWYQTEFPQECSVSDQISFHYNNIRTQCDEFTSKLSCLPDPQKKYKGLLAKMRKLKRDLEITRDKLKLRGSPPVPSPRGSRLRSLRSAGRTGSLQSLIGIPETTLDRGDPFQSGDTAIFNEIQTSTDESSTEKSGEIELPILQDIQDVFEGDIITNPLGIGTSDNEETVYIVGCPRTKDIDSVIESHNKLSQYAASLNSEMESANSVIQANKKSADIAISSVRNEIRSLHEAISTLTTKNNSLENTFRSKYESVLNKVALASKNTQDIANKQDEILSLIDFNKLTAESAEERSISLASLVKTQKANLKELALKLDRISSTPIPSVNVPPEPSDKGSRSTSPANPQQCMNSCTMSFNQTMTTAPALELTVKSLIGKINRALAEDIENEDLTDSQLKELMNKNRTTAEEDIYRCRSSMEKYSTLGEQDPEFTDFVQAELERSEEYIRRLESVYRNRKQNFSEPLKEFDTALAKFEPTGEVDIIEFISKFEKKVGHRATERQKAEIMWNNFLNISLQNATIDINEDYKKLKAYLLRTHGNIHVVCDVIMKKIEQATIPEISDTRGRHEHMTTLNVAIMKLEKLSRDPNVSREQWESTVLSPYFFKRLTNVLQRETYEKLADRLGYAGITDTPYQGARAFQELRNFCQMQLNTTVSLAGRPAEKNTQKRTGNSVQIVTETEQQDREEREMEPMLSRAIHTMSAKSWWDKRFKQPCPLKDHFHEVGSCKTFLQLSNLKRRRLSAQLCCYTCVYPKELCLKKMEGTATPYKCSREKSIDPSLICSECEEYVKSIQAEFSPVNLMYCTMRGHKKQTFASIKGKIKSLLPGYSVENPPINENTTINTFHYPNGNLPKEKKSVALLRMNTITGEMTRDDTEDYIKEPTGPVAYALQWLLIGGRPTLTFFDSGANISVIQGKQAEEQGMDRMDNSPKSFGVCGGKKVETNFGVYRFGVGPDINGKCREMKAQGLEQVTSYFPKLPLDEVKQELRQHCPDMSELPDYVGGGEVHLLIGIRDPTLQPRWLTTLPSGTCVYESRFTDIWGSNICIAGPHPSFQKYVNANNAHLFNSVHNFARLIDPFYRNLNIFSSSDEYLFGPKCGQDIYPILTSCDEESIQTEATPLSEQSLNHIWGARPCLHHFEHEHVHKFTMVNLTDELEASEGKTIPNYRCAECENCETCKMTPKSRAMTAQEEIEQRAIEKSVTMDFEAKYPIITLPFLRDPVPYLKNLFRARDNYNVAAKVYLQQCRKHPALKESLRKVLDDMTEKGFVVDINKLPEEEKAIITKAEINHFSPWRMVQKEDSLSTPVRMVVDPTMTGLNNIIAKGENRLGKLTEILIRNRVKRYAFSTDISKMYNVLRLHPSMYPFSLFLYHRSLDEQIKPAIHLMMRGWYGIKSMGNQAGFSVKRAVDHKKEIFPKVEKPLTDDKYVDDVLTGEDTKGERTEVINQCTQVLAAAGFNLKYVAKSGEPPCEKSSSDGKTIRILGYVWATEEDVISPGMGEMNFNKKIRGAKKPNEQPITTPEDVKSLLDSLALSKRSVASKLAEMYDPIGLWEPIKLALKLEFTSLNPMRWDEELDLEKRELWSEAFQKVIEIPGLKVKRCVIPEDAKTLKMRLLGFSDAAARAGGAALYASFEKIDGTYSSQLLTAKSRLMDSTVPRNELGGILLMAELVHTTYRSITEYVKEIHCFTDSTIALSWMHNQNKKLKTYVLNRVQTARRLMKWSNMLDEELPLYHVPGTENIADLLTKPLEISMELVEEGSKWQQGPGWLANPIQDMPIKKYSELVLDRSTALEMAKECVETPFCILQAQPESDEDRTCNKLTAAFSWDKEEETPERSIHVTETRVEEKAVFGVELTSKGWYRSVRTLTLAFKFVQVYRHTFHKREKTECILCQTPTEESIDLDRVSKEKAEKFVFRAETKIIKKTYTPNQMALYTENEGILWYVSRLDENIEVQTRDIDLEIFLDSHEFLDKIPVVRAESPVFFTYLMYIHFYLLPHAGVETTRREVMKKMYIKGDDRKIVRRTRNDCPKCRLIARKTLELIMAKHSFARTMIAPPFYNVMIDIMMNFRASAYLKARKVFNINALVVVCLLTSATNILVLESIETQSVAMAIQRHGARYGMPANVFVDSGSQLISLETMKFSIRDLDTSVKESTGINVVVSTPKSHEERGRVERKIRTIREILARTAETSKEILSVISWETRFALIANSIDDIPLARAISSNSTEYPYEILTPNRLKLGRNNRRSPHTRISLGNPTLPTDILDRNRKITETFYQVMLDRIHELVGRPDKWGVKEMPNAQVDDVVIFVHNDSKVGKDWRLGRIVEVTGRTVEIVYTVKSNGDLISRLGRVRRSLRQISLVVGKDEMNLNSAEYRKLCTRVS